MNGKERKALAADLKSIYRAASAETAESALRAFRIKYPKHQVAADVWERNWQLEAQKEVALSTDADW